MTREGLTFVATATFFCPAKFIHYAIENQNEVRQTNYQFSVYQHAEEGYQKVMGNPQELMILIGHIAEMGEECLINYSIDWKPNGPK